MGGYSRVLAAQREAELGGGVQKESLASEEEDCKGSECFTCRPQDGAQRCWRARLPNEQGRRVHLYAAAFPWHLGYGGDDLGISKG
ncbi:hypothetical protein AXG93_4346s1070 [Marchantia polymorpha subsp. ruderalis]|uniref:Uncharacterized protein n=1 Tax=Marchantia polymorpha subsp. ruderalis TaxID=1480154 RepID=A0A176WUA0_MARPO|nr:hypothetical protein AXG93_4346s1070 [Marchantia polymorpha subsp. ruderalis]